MKGHHIEITDTASAFVQAQLGEGSYVDTSDYIERLIQEDRLTREALQKSVSDRGKELEQQMLDGLESGDSITVDPEYWTKERQRLTDEFSG